MKKKFLIVLLVLLFSACALVEGGFVFYGNGYWDDTANYVPIRPKYELKDKQGSICSIDTSSVYKLVQRYDNGQLIYPIYSDIENIYSKNYFKNRHSFYIKFCEKGRCFYFYGVKDSLRKCDIDPNETLKKWYYTCNGKDIKIESFEKSKKRHHGNYVIKNYLLNKSMDTLTQTPDKYSSHYSIYKKVSIPVNLKKYKIDW